MIDHDFIIKSIIDLDGVIVGGYVREWIANGAPSDTGWKDIDICCPIENVYAINTVLKEKNMPIRFDFMPAYLKVNSNGIIGGYWSTRYTCDHFEYDGSFKIINTKLTSTVETKDWFNITKNKEFYIVSDKKEHPAFLYKRPKVRNLTSIGWKFMGEKSFSK